MASHLPKIYIRTWYPIVHTTKYDASAQVDPVLTRSYYTSSHHIVSRNLPVGLLSNRHPVSSSSAPCFRQQNRSQTCLCLPQFHIMADMLMNMGTTRKVSFGLNGKLNGFESKTPFLIGVSGGTASGKSTVCKRIMEKLGQVDMDHQQRQVVVISQDSFYRDLTPAEKLKAEKGQFNFDHPDAFDNDLILQTLQDILAGIKCEIPAYDYRTNSLIKDQITTIYPADVVLFEGILVFYFPKIRDLFHMKLFVDTDSDTRLARRVPRDIKERGRDLDYVLNQYMNFVKPAFEEFCLPTKKFADVIIPRGADNTVAIDLIVHHIWDILRLKKAENASGQYPYVYQHRRTSASSDILSR